MLCENVEVTADGTCTFCGAPDVLDQDAFAQNDACICVRCVAILQFLKEAPVGLPSVHGEEPVPTGDLRSETLRILQERAEPDDGLDRSAGSFPSRRSRESSPRPETRFNDVYVPDDETCRLCGDDSGERRPYVMRATRAVICSACLDLAVAWLVHPSRH